MFDKFTTFPVYPPHANGSCSCGNPACEDAGKHPAVRWGAKALGDAPVQVPIPEGYNIGLATGSRSGNVLVLDIDTKGEDGYATLALLAPGDLPTTLAARTPSGGAHLYFRLPRGVRIKNSVRKLGPGLDIRAEGGFVVIPPSLHRSGGRYEWVEPLADIAPCPDWLLALLTGKGGGLPVTREMLEKIAKTWRRSRNVHRQTLGEALECVVRGESFAEHGAREQTLWELGRGLAETCPHATPEEMAELFRPSLERMQADGSTHGYEDALERFTRLLAPGETWTSRLLVSDTGEPRACQANVAVVVECHEAFRGALGYDERAGREVWTLPAPWAPAGEEPGRLVSDDDAVDLTVWLAEHQHLAVGREPCRYALDTVARRRPFDPLRDELEALEWDGVARVDGFLARYAGAPADDYARMVSRRFLISLVARAMDPGCKVDTMPILLGAQGVGKSTLLRVLAGERYFADSLPDIESKDALTYLQGRWIVEVKELEAFGRKEATAIKGFIDQRVDIYRPPYGAKEIERPRRCVFVGTTNAEQHHRDTTGARRFWTVSCNRCDIEALERDRDQVLAEAVELYRRGERWWLDAAEEAVAAEVQEAHRERDPWEAEIEVMVVEGVRKPTWGAAAEGAPPEWVIPPGGPVTVGEVLEQLGVPKGLRGRAQEIRVGQVMARLGWGRRRVRVGAGKRYEYISPQGAREGR